MKIQLLKAKLNQVSEPYNALIVDSNSQSSQDLRIIPCHSAVGISVNLPLTEHARVCLCQRAPSRMPGTKPFIPYALSCCWLKTDRDSCCYFRKYQKSLCFFDLQAPFTLFLLQGSRK